MRSQLHTATAVHPGVRAPVLRWGDTPRAHLVSSTISRRDLGVRQSCQESEPQRREEAERAGLLTTKTLGSASTLLRRF